VINDYGNAAKALPSYECLSIWNSRL